MWTERNNACVSENCGSRSERFLNSMRPLQFDMPSWIKYFDSFSIKYCFPFFWYKISLNPSHDRARSRSAETMCSGLSVLKSLTSREIRQTGGGNALRHHDEDGTLEFAIRDKAATPLIDPGPPGLCNRRIHRIAGGNRVAVTRRVAAALSPATRSGTVTVPVTVQLSLGSPPPATLPGPWQQLGPGHRRSASEPVPRPPARGRPGPPADHQPGHQRLAT